MMIFEVIDYLFIFTGYLVWAMGLFGLVGSVVLALFNISMGLPAVLLCVAAFLLSVAVVLLLIPEKFNKKLPTKLFEKRYVIAIITLVVATAMTGIVYFTNGGFPALNLIFMTIGG